MSSVATMFDRIADLEREYAGAEARMADPAIHSDQQRYADTAKRHSELKPIVEAYRAGTA